MSWVGVSMLVEYQNSGEAKLISNIHSENFDSISFQRTGLKKEGKLTGSIHSMSLEPYKNA